MNIDHEHQLPGSEGESRARCCGDERQATCCDSDEKATCCGNEATVGGGSGCR